MGTAFIYHPRYLLHNAGIPHPERPDRLRAIVERLKESGVWDQLHHIQPQPAERGWVELVHLPEYIAAIELAARSAPAFLDPDTPVGQESFDVALLAVGGAIAACDAVISGKCHNAFAAVRPPGHHAERATAMGFCLFNNVAIASRYLQQHHGLARVAILDWDVHHGNGTQHILEDDPSIFYISIHQHPLYPGTGLRTERGTGRGVGTTLNIPIPGGCGDSDYAVALNEVEEALNRFQPEFLLVSAGFDAHYRDPLASMQLTADGFQHLAKRVVQLAQRHCQNRLVMVLEGGYDLTGLSTSVQACLQEMLAVAGNVALS